MFRNSKENFKTYFSPYSRTKILEVGFKPNSTLQNRLVRRELHPLIYCELTLSLVDMGLPTHPLTPRYIYLVRGTRN